MLLLRSLEGRLPGASDSDGLGFRSLVHCDEGGSRGPPGVLPSESPPTIDTSWLCERVVAFVAGWQIEKGIFFFLY